MASCAIPSLMVKGAGLAHRIGRAYAIQALLAIRERPGVGTYQLSTMIGANPITTRGLLEHFEQNGLVTVTRQTGSNKTTSAHLTPEGALLAEDLEDLVHRRYPDPEDEPPREPDPEELLERRGAREGLIALLERDLTVQEWDELMPPTRSINYGRDLWQRLERAGIVDLVVVQRKGKPRNGLTLTSAGRAVAERLAELQRALDEAAEKEGKKSGRRA